MLTTCILYLAAVGVDAASVSKKFRAFYEQHPSLSVDCAISGFGGTGAGTLIIRRPNGVTKVDWSVASTGDEYRFVTNGSMSIETDKATRLYDHLVSTNHPVPVGRVKEVFGFPFPVVAGLLPFSGKGVKVTQKGALTELEFVSHGMQGDTKYVGDFAADGRLDSFDTAKGGGDRWEHEHIAFSNYRFGASAKTSTFSVEPPIGYGAYAFDPVPDILTTDALIPAVKLSGPSTTTLSALCKKPRVVVAFVDDPMPPGLVSSLGHLKSKVALVIVGLTGAAVHAGQFPIYRASEAGFDTAGVRATPQFYAVRKGKVIQAWSGFRQRDALKFEAAVLASFGTH